MLWPGFCGHCKGRWLSKHEYHVRNMSVTVVRASWENMSTKVAVSRPLSAQDVLEELEQQYPFAMVVTDEVNRLADMNEGAKRLLGSSADVLRGQPLWSQDVDFSKSEFIKVECKAVLGPNGCRCGKNQWYVAPIKAKTKREMGSNGTSKFQAYLVREDECAHVKNSISNWQPSVYGSMNDVAMIQCDVEGRIIEVSIGAVRMFGYDNRKALIGQDASVLVAPPAQRFHSKFVTRYIKTKQPRIVGTGGHVAPALDRDGNQFDVHLNIWDVRVDGAVKGFLACVQKTNVRRNANLLSEERNYILNYTKDNHYMSAVSKGVSIYETITEATFYNSQCVKETVILMDSDQCISYCARQTAFMFGYDEEELIGQPLTLLLEDDLATKHEGYVFDYYASGRKKAIGGTASGLAKRKDGSLIQVSVAVEEVEVGTELFFLGWIRDEEFIRSGPDTITKLGQVSVSVRNFIEQSLSKDAIALCVDSAGTILSISENCLNLLGVSEEALDGKNMSTFVDIEPGWTPRDGLFDFNVRLQGGYVKARSNVRQSTQGDGSYTIVLWLSAVDMNAKDQVQSLMKLYDVSFEEAPTAMLTTDLQGEIMACNKQFLKLYGYSLDNILGKHASCIFAQPHSSEYAKAMASFPKIGDTCVFEMDQDYIGLREDGEAFSMTMTVLDAPLANPRRLLHIINDVTKLRKAASQEREEAERGDALLDSLDLGAIVTDELCNVQMINKVACSMFRTSAKKAIGTNVNVFMPPDVAHRHDQYVSSYLQSGERRALGKKRAVSALAGDKVFSIEVDLQEIWVQDNRMFMALLRDLTPYLDEEARMESRNAIVKDFCEKYSEPTMLVGYDGTILHVNVTCADLVGGDAAGENVSSLVPPPYDENHDQMMQAWIRDIKGNEKREMVRDALVLRKDKTVAPVTLRVQTGHSHYGTDAMTVHMLDRTQLQKREESMRKMEKQVSQIFENSSSGIVNADDTGKILSLNPAAEKMFGISHKDSVGQLVDILIPSPHKERHQDFIDNYMKTKVRKVLGLSRRVEALRADGSVFPVELSLSETVVENKVAFSAMFRDMESTVNREFRILKEQSGVDTAMSLVEEGVVLCDSDGTIMIVSDETERIFKSSKKNLIGKNIAVLMPENIAWKHHQYMQRLLYHGQVKNTGKWIEVQGKQSDGTLISLDLMVVGVSHAGDTLVVTAKLVMAEEKALTREVNSVSSINLPISMRPSNMPVPSIAEMGSPVKDLLQSPPNRTPKQLSADDPLASRMNTGRLSVGSVAAPTRAHMATPHESRGSVRRPRNSSGRGSLGLDLNRLNTANRELGRDSTSTKKGVAYDELLERDYQHGFEDPAVGLEPEDKYDTLPNAPYFDPKVEEMRSRLAPERAALITELEDTIADDATGVSEKVAVWLGMVSKLLRWPVAVMLMWSPVHHRIVPKKYYTEDQVKYATFLSDTMSEHVKPGVGVAGDAFFKRVPAFLVNIQRDDTFVTSKRGESAVHSGLKAGVWVPVPAGYPVAKKEEGFGEWATNREVVGMIEFFSGQEEHADKNLVEFLLVVADRLGRVIDRRRKNYFY